MVKTLRLLVGALAALALTGAAVAQAPHAVLSGAASYDAGTVKQAQVISHTVTLKNTGAGTLTLEMPAVSMGDVKVWFRPVVLPGEQQDIRLQWNAGNKAGDLQAEVAFATNDPALPRLLLSLHANVKPAVEVLPIPAFFLSVFKGERLQQTRDIVVNQDAPLALGQPQSPSKNYSASLKTIEAGRRYQLVLNLSPDAPAGRYIESLAIPTDDKTRPSLNVPVNLLVKEDIYVFPEAVDFGRINAQEFKAFPDRLPLLTQTLLVKKREGQKLSVTRVESDVPCLDFKVTSPSDEAGAYQIDIAPKLDRLTPGPLAGKLRIHTTNPRFPVLTVPITGEIF
jgi:hypothetical protein